MSVRPEVSTNRVTDSTLDDERWEAVRRRDRTADTFFLAVRTTGVYCRPGCPARLPNRKNVVFFTGRGEAEAEGYRPCKRCRPDAPQPDPELSEAIARACRLIEEAEELPSLQELAAAAGYSPSHFHRAFKRMVGVTPRAYAAMRRVTRAQDRLVRGDTVTQALYEAGYGSSSRFYDEATGVLGMRPSEFRGRAAGQGIRVAVAPNYLGFVLVAGTRKGICLIELGNSEKELRASLKQRFPDARVEEDDEEFQTWVAAVVALLEAPGRGHALPLDVQGTAFQRRVWEALQSIPPGTTASYSEVAERIGRPTAARAVARACAVNPLAVAIPCHRVVARDGSLTGYRGGLNRKRALLDREAAVRKLV